MSEFIFDRSAEITFETFSDVDKEGCVFETTFIVYQEVFEEQKAVVPIRFH
jgi:hypothetical protein